MSASRSKEERLYGKGTVLVRADGEPGPRFPKMGPNVPPDTYYVQNQIGALLQMVTITPRGLWCGWDSCSGCLRTVGHCTCRAGVRASEAIRHAWVFDGGILPDEKKVEHVPLPPRLALREPYIPMQRRHKPKRPSEKMTVTLRRKGH